MLVDPLVLVGYLPGCAPGVEEGELLSRQVWFGVSSIVNKALPPEPIPRSSLLMRKTWVPLAISTVQLKCHLGWCHESRRFYYTAIHIVMDGMVR